MKRLSMENKKKLKYFMEQQENMMGVVVLFTILTYAILMIFTKNFFILISGYYILYILYTKLYKYIYKKMFFSE